MLVYGDSAREAEPEALLRDLRARLTAAEAAAGPARLDALTGALICAGDLARGVADAETEAAGVDDLSPVREATMALAIAVAGKLLRAAGQPVAAHGDAAPAMAQVAALATSPIRRGVSEGYAFYALYPEGYAAAAAARRWEAPLVLGLRGIGASLAAVVAAHLGAEALTLRPMGHPFRRELRLSEALRAHLCRHAGAFLVVDEGPGISGSSFGAVGDLLEGLGVAEERIVYMPSHGGAPGAQAAPAHRERWARATRLVGGAVPSPEKITDWFADIAGAESRSEDLSAGKWRRHLPEACRPPATPSLERVKARLSGPRGRFVARFAGLGEIGEEKFALARRLYAVGFVPEPLALRRGFLLERWVPGAPPRAASPRDLATIARYIGYRARSFPAGTPGASLEALRHMAVHNAGELGGAALAEAVERRLARLDRLGGLVPARIDGRLHRWEWLRTPDGGLCKTDALDHAVAHDLVGCQDIAWDIAGAAVEFGLEGATLDEFRETVAAAGRRPAGAETVAAFRLCYAAFQGGLWRMMGEPGPRTERQVARYLVDLGRTTGLAPVGRERSRAPSVVP